MALNFMQEANAIAASLQGKPVPVRDGMRGKNLHPSARNLEVLAFMRAFFAENDQLPPLARVAEHFGLNTNGADWHVQALLRHGCLERNVVGGLRFARRGEAQA